MPRTYKRIDAEYTTAEATETTGASASLQRDWRRRAILSGAKEERHISLSFADLCELFALKAFLDAGLDLWDINNRDDRVGQELKSGYDAESAVQLCLFPMLYFADRFMAENKLLELYSTRTTRPESEIGRYVFVNRKRMLQVRDLKSVAIERGLEWEPVITMFDCKANAETIVSRLPRLPYEFVAAEPSLES